MIVARDPADDGRRILAVTKSNLALEAPSLAFRLSPDEIRNVAKVTWDGETNHFADDLVQIRPDTGEELKLDAAMDALRDVLEGGPIPASEAKEAVKREIARVSELGRESPGSS
ncbi:MAG TPA: hypothetical protein VEV82_09650 [Actinomycetota bacterium]|nr:hypothetical protein [Actinomycetota bacterium]